MRSRTVDQLRETPDGDSLQLCEGGESEAPTRVNTIIQGMITSCYIPEISQHPFFLQLV
jgi:hypothetical protein